MANMRALGDIQRRGLEAANLVIGRLIGQVERGGPLLGAEPPRTESGGTSGAAPDVADLVAQYSSMVSSWLVPFVGNGAPAAPGAGTTASSVVWVDPLTLPPSAPGGTSQGEMWLHNRSGASVSDVRVHCGDLRRHDGWAIAGAHVTFAPPQLDELPDLTSRGLRTVVDVPPDAPPGTYRGTVLAANLPEVWLGIELEVVADQ